MSHRILSVTEGDLGLFQASFFTVYRVLVAHNLIHARCPGGVHNGNSKAPVRKELTGPNQRWCWDISYLMTFQKGEYLYLYMVSTPAKLSSGVLPGTRQPGSRRFCSRTGCSTRIF